MTEFDDMTVREVINTTAKGMRKLAGDLLDMNFAEFRELHAGLSESVRGVKIPDGGISPIEINHHNYFALLELAEPQEKFGIVSVRLVSADDDPTARAANSTLRGGSNVQVIVRRPSPSGDGIVVEDGIDGDMLVLDDNLNWRIKKGEKRNDGDRDKEVEAGPASKISGTTQEADQVRSSKYNVGDLVEWKDHKGLLHVCRVNPDATITECLDCDGAALNLHDIAGDRSIVVCDSQVQPLRTEEIAAEFAMSPEEIEELAATDIGFATYVQMVMDGNNVPRPLRPAPAGFCRCEKCGILFRPHQGNGKDRCPDHDVPNFGIRRIKCPFCNGLGRIVNEHGDWQQCGWCDGGEYDPERYTIQEIMLEAYDTAKAKGWHNDSPGLPTALALIHSEVSEALEGYRNDDMDNVAEELADVVIRTGDTAAEYNIDLTRAIAKKMAANRKREHRHGGKKV